MADGRGKERVQRKVMEGREEKRRKTLDQTKA